MAVQEKVDVVTIGAGWTAAILAWKLTQEGVKVRSLEQGRERWTSTDFQHNHDALRYSVRKALMADVSNEAWTWRPNPNKPSLPMRRHQSFHPGSGLGGLVSIGLLNHGDSIRPTFSIVLIMWNDTEKPSSRKAPRFRIGR